MGLDFLSLYTIYFNDLKIDKKYILGEQNKGWNIIVKYFNWDKLLLAAMFVGIGEKALDIAIKYSKQRKVFDKIIGSYQGIQFPLAEAHINLVAAKALINQAKEYPDDIDLVFSAYYTALNAASQAIDTSLQVLGAKGYLKNSLIEKFYRDIRYYKIGPLSKELLLANIAYRVLGLPKSY
jgi:alkylation response protein AidB-like acyl-CoA dehydrogenase